MSFGARATIRLDALKQNFRRLKSAAPGCKVIAAVKANAYGHGLTTISAALADADSLAVARLVEAEQLREAGIETPILLMAGVVDAPELRQALALRCDLVIHTEHQVRLLEANQLAATRVWLKVNTGMHRLGVSIDDASALYDRLRRVGGVEQPGLMTHLANADDVSDPASMQQFERFRCLSENLDGDISIANSAALLGWAGQIAEPTLWSNRGDVWIRPGISLYGISPLAGRSASELGLDPVMQFETSLVAVNPVRKGERVGYGGTWTAPADSVIGIAAAGYGDGYSRFLPSGTPVLVNGRRVALAGVVSMDLLAVDLGAGADDHIGDPVVLWGAGLPVEEVARYADTTAYPLVTGIVDRGRRLR